jgi:hypothetical protein
MSKEPKVETIRLPVSSDRRVDSTIASQLTDATLRRIRGIQAAAARDARRQLAR